MANYIHLDESLQVLVFVVLPLLLLLVTAIFLRIRYALPSTAKFPTFSVSLCAVGREDAYIVYRDNEQRLEFYVGPGTRKQQLYLQVPKRLRDDDIRELVPNLELGLAKLGFHKYRIVQEGETEIIARGPQDSDTDKSQ